MEIAPVFVFHQVFEGLLVHLPLPQDDIDIGGEDTLRLLIVLSLALQFVIVFIVDFAICYPLRHVLVAVGLFESHRL